MNDQSGRYARLRYTATGALAALATVGAIAGTIALAAKPHAKTHGHAAAANGSTANGGATKTPSSGVPVKTPASQPPTSPQPFLTAIQQLVDSGTITATQGQAVDREILAGRVDTDTLASSGFTQTQLQAVQDALSNTKRAMGPAGPSGVGKNSTPRSDAKTRHS